MTTGFIDQLTQAFILLCYAYGLLVVTWPAFLLLEKLSPVNKNTSASAT